MSSFQKATTDNIKLKVSIQGISGAGKTYTALKLATLIGGKIAVIDTERGKSQLYSNEFNFDVISLTDHHPNNFYKLIDEAEKAGYSHLIIDSLSHMWMGTNGVLQLVEQATQASTSKNSFQAWGKVDPIYKRVIDKILDCNMHCFVTLRAKKAYIQTKNEKTGRNEIQCVGLEAIQKEGLEFEFDINTSMDLDHNLVITKSRLRKIDKLLYQLPGEEFVRDMKASLMLGKGDMTDYTAEEVQFTPATQPIEKAESSPIAEQTVPMSLQAPVIVITAQQANELYNAALRIGHTNDSLKQILAEYDLDSFKKIPQSKFEVIREHILIQADPNNHTELNLND